MINTFNLFNIKNIMKKVFLFIFLLFFSLINTTFSNFIIYEVLPNTDDDVNMEYISIKNNSSNWKSLDWYSISDKWWKTYNITGDYLSWWQIKKYYRTQTNIILNNTNEELYLYDSNNSLIDTFSYTSSENNLAIKYNDSSNQNDDDNLDDDNNYYKYDSNIKSRKEIFDKPSIIVQSWLDENNFCYKKECLVNFKYDTNNKNLTCYWDFWDDFVVYGCNPEHLNFWEWKHELVLEVCDKNYSDHCKNTHFIFRNLYKKTKTKAKITLQWDLTTWKMFKWDILVCDWVDSCSVNLTASESTGDDLSYFWDLSNETYFSIKDPSSLIFEKWYYDIMLEVVDIDWNMDRDFFKLEVTWKYEEINSKEIDEENNIDEKNISDYQNQINELKEIIENFSLSSSYTNDYKKDFFQNDNSEIIDVQNYSEVNLKIQVQWKIGQNKELLDNKLICYETCSVNFDASESIWNISSYYWDFWNWETYDWVNPWYISYDNPWIYNVTLKIYDNYSREFKSYFEVEFLSSKNDEIIEEELIIEDNISFDELWKNENIDDGISEKIDDNSNETNDLKLDETENNYLENDNDMNNMKKYFLYMILFFVVIISILVFYILNNKYNFF